MRLSGDGELELFYFLTWADWVAGGTELKFCACVISNQLSTFQVHRRSAGGDSLGLRPRQKTNFSAVQSNRLQVTEVSKVTHLLLSIISLNTCWFKALPRKKYSVFILPHGSKLSTTEVCP